MLAEVCGDSSLRWKPEGTLSEYEDDTPKQMELSASAAKLEQTQAAKGKLCGLVRPRVGQAHLK